MKRIATVLLGVTSLVSARSAFLSVPRTYATLTPAVRVSSADEGAAVDNPVARTQHVDERVNLANEVAHQVQPSWQRSSLLVDDDVNAALTSSAPLGADGRVVDTAEVAAAKAAHAAAHANERLNLMNEAARSSVESSQVDDAIAASETLIGTNGGILDTSAARAAYRNDESNPANAEAAPFVDILTRIADGTVVPLVPLSDGIVAALVPIAPDGRSPDAPDVVARGNQKKNITNDLKSVDALAIAGPALAYGRLVY